MKGHRGFVNALALLIDGRLASGSSDHLIKIWDVQSEKCLQTLKGHKKEVESLTVLPSGNLVSGSDDNKIKIWDIQSGKCVQTLKKHTNTVQALTPLPEGRFASGCFSWEINIWDSKSGQCLQTLDLTEGWCTVYALAPLPDGRLASGSSDHKIKIWDVESGKCLQTLIGHDSNVNALIILPDGRLASGSSDHKIKIWDIKSGRCLQTLSGHTNSVQALTLLPNGRLVSGSFDNHIKIWDFPELRLEKTSVRVNIATPITPSPNKVKKPEKKVSSTKIDEAGDLQISLTISYQQLKFGRELGRGGFGVVYEGQYQYGQVAIKTLLYQNLKDSLIEDFKKEAFIMAKLRCPFIVSLYGICLEKPHYALVMEYMANGSLCNFLQNDEPISWKSRYQIGTDIGVGLAYLHNHEMVHCDLKSLNILLDVNYRAKISDFGLSKVKLETSFSTMAGGSTRWMAPELFQEGAKSTKAADVYAFGLVLWELGSRKFPFATTRNEAVPMLVCQGKREEISKDTPLNMAKLIAKCWDGRAELRPTMDGAVRTLQAEQATYKNQ